MGEANKILIVDDESIGRQLLEAIFFTEGYELLFAENGNDALNLAKSEKPDVLLLDVMMPGLDGFEVCRQVRSDPKIGNTPIILITALDDRDSRLKGLEAGANDYLSKPFDRIEVLTKVRTIAQLRQNNVPDHKPLKDNTIIQSNAVSTGNYPDLLLDTIAPAHGYMEKLFPGHFIFRKNIDKLPRILFTSGEISDSKYILIVKDNSNNSEGQLQLLLIINLIQQTLKDISTPETFSIAHAIYERIDKDKKFNVLNPDEYSITLAFVKKGSDTFYVSGVQSNFIIVRENNIESFNLRDKSSEKGPHSFTLSEKDALMLISTSLAVNEEPDYIKAIQSDLKEVFINIADKTGTSEAAKTNVGPIADIINNMLFIALKT
ncbi:MAG: response regulator [Bacteroidales bacterium]|nr:response regulator [Bacteroidales bacterium]